MVDIPEYIQQLETLVNIESGSYNVEGINLVATKIESWYRQLGWRIVRHDLGQQTGKLLEISNRLSDHYDITFVGHMDTVFPEGTVSKRPFSHDHKNAYGPGVADMKNGLAAMYQIAKCLPRSTSEKINICMAFNPDEEIGSIYSKEALDSIGQKSDFVFIMESSGNGGYGHCFARKGRLSCDIRFHGQAAHSGFIFEEKNASAILEMGHFIVNIMSYTDEKEGTSVNVGLARGGIAVNVVPDYAEISLEVRFSKSSERIHLMNALNLLKNRAPIVKGVNVEITNFRDTPPWERNENTEALKRRIETIAKKIDIPFFYKDRGGLSDANHLASCGCICCDGMGPHGALDHSEKEYTIIDSIQPCVGLNLAILEDIASKRRR